MSLTSALTTAAAMPFRAGSALRGARVVHPRGVRLRGTWTIDRTDPLAPQAAVLQQGARFDCVVRASRGAGFPEPIPDSFGLAVKLIDAYGEGRHQDVLANVSADLPLVHHLFLVAPRWFAQSYSTVLPYDAGAGTIVIGFTPPAERGPGPRAEDLAEWLAERPARFGINVAAPLGRWQRIGTLELGAPIGEDEHLQFEPWHCGGGLRPVGALNRLRREAYRQSRRGRGAPVEAA